jgi:WhiB family redox-sensing transcriptional regulator
MESKRIPGFFNQAACTGVNPETFQSEHPSRIAAAKRVCVTCPILSDCLNWAIDNFEEGVWGGTTSWERQSVSGIESKLDVDELAQRRAARSRLEEDVAIRTLAEEFQVTERTIHRWKAQIQKEAS